MNKRNLLLINQAQKGVLYPFPSSFMLPESVTVGEPEIQFFKTDRVKTMNGETMPIYAEKNLNFSLDEVSDPRDDVEEPITKQQVEAYQSERKGTNYPVSPDPMPSPLAKNADEEVLEELQEIIAAEMDYEETLDAIVKWHNNNLLNRI